MTLGALARRMLGERAFVRAADLYRSIFVDLDAVVDCLPAPPPAAEILDVGGGDGALLDRLLARHADARATLVDLAPQIGVAISPERRARVRLLPATRLADARAAGAPRPDWIVLSDVLHHVPRAERDGLLQEVRAAAEGRPFTLIVKEVAPGGFRSRLAVLADRWVSGDRGVALLAPDETRALVAGVLPELVAHEAPLYERDQPNYCVVFRGRDAR
jgi:Methyltransferase domain